MFLRRLLTVGLIFIGLIVISLFLIRFLITRSITCAPACVGVNLLARDLQGINLQGAKLMEAQLQNTDLSGANLRDVDLSGASLLRANLRNADLTDARLIGADLTQARLEGSILKGADLSGANLSEADLTNVDLRATLVGGVNFAKAKMTNVQLQGSNLSGSDFSGAGMAGANLTKANLAGAAISGADLSGATLVQADLTGAWLNLTNLVGADLTDADLAGSSLLGAVLASANLQSSNLAGAVLVGAQLDGANLRGANLHDARIWQTQFPTRTLQLDPILQGLNELQRQSLPQDVNLSGVAFDGQTVWPADAAPLAAPVADNQLSLPPQATSDSGSSASPNDTTTATTLAGQADENVEGLPVAKRLAMNFYINSIRNIRSQTNEFTADLYVDLFWQESTIPAGQDIAELDPATLWNPQLNLVNSRNGRFLYEAYDTSSEPETNVRLSYRAVGDFAAAFDLHRFPFDRQDLVIKLEPGNGNSDDALLEFIDLNQHQPPSEQPYIQEIPKGRYVDNQALSGEWIVRSARIAQQLYIYSHDQSSRSRFQIELTVGRRAAPYVWKYMAPLVLLALLAWSVCLVSSQALVYRLWLLAILLLTLAAFHAIVWGNLPKMPYPTYLDRFLLLHYSVLVGLISLVFAIKFLERGHHLRVARWLNRGLVAGYPLGYLGLIFLLYWQSSG